ncbi:hypothetical protein [Streptomyces graminofaciens]|nr:hypothetical protein [Streptomyces graminofaciens]
MAAVTPKNKFLRKRAMRAGAMSVLCAAVFTGLATIPAHAAGQDWGFSSDFFTSASERDSAQKAKEGECRRMDGVVVFSDAHEVTNDDGSISYFYYFFVGCQPKR